MKRSIKVLVLAFAPFGITASTTYGQENRSHWQRVKRVAVYNSPRRARFPSITKSKDGSLLVLFTRQTAQQEKAGQGDLVLVRSTDAGRTWSDGQVVFQGKAGEPRKDGRIIAPFCVLGEAQATSAARLLTSKDNGRNWQVGDIAANCPLVWWAPVGKCWRPPMAH